MKIVRPTLDSYAIDRLRERSLDVLSGGTRRAGRETLRALDESVARAVSAADPRGLYMRANISGIDGSAVRTSEGDIDSAKFASIAKEAQGNTRMVVFTIATVGGTFGDELAAEESLLDKFVLDAVGSELAEIVADLVEETWKNEMALAGLDASLRMSPGYCDWALEGQNVIFTALDSSAIGVRLTPSYLMIPAKSVSAAAIVAEHVPLKVACARCGRSDCPFRRAELETGYAEATPGTDGALEPM
jgi:hypothetical protein